MRSNPHEFSWHYGPPDGWQMRHASPFILGITSLQQSNSVGEGHALN